MNTTTEQRQKILILYMATTSLTSMVIAWSLFDGSGVELPACGTDEPPPYLTAFGAIQDGWRMIDIFPPTFPVEDPEKQMLDLKYRVVLEKLVPYDA